jgi:hypothetical protein
MPCAFHGLLRVPRFTPHTLLGLLLARYLSLRFTRIAPRSALSAVPDTDRSVLEHLWRSRRSWITPSSTLDTRRFAQIAPRLRSECPVPPANCFALNTSRFLPDSDFSDSQTVPNLGLRRVSDCSAAWIAPCRVLSARSVRGLLRARYLTLHADLGSLRVSDRSAPPTVPCSTPAALCLSLTLSCYGSLRTTAPSAPRIAPCRHLRSSPCADCSVLGT